MRNQSVAEVALLVLVTAQKMVTLGAFFGAATVAFPPFSCTDGIVFNPVTCPAIRQTMREEILVSIGYTTAPVARNIGNTEPSQLRLL